jgi:hypothetical protein
VPTAECAGQRGSPDHGYDGQGDWLRPPWCKKLDAVDDKNEVILVIFWLGFPNIVKNAQDMLS